MGQIMLLSRVASHKLSAASTPLVGRLALLEGGFLLGSSIRCSRLVWGRRVGALVLSAWPPPSFFPSPSLSLDFGGGVGPPIPLGVGGPLVGFIVFPSSSLPLDTGGGVGPPTPLGVGGPLVGFIVSSPAEGGDD